MLLTCQQGSLHCTTLSAKSKRESKHDFLSFQFWPEFYCTPFLGRGYDVTRYCNHHVFVISLLKYHDVLFTWLPLLGIHNLVYIWYYMLKKYHLFVHTLLYNAYCVLNLCIMILCHADSKLHIMHNLLHIFKIALHICACFLHNFDIFYSIFLHIFAYPAYWCLQAVHTFWHILCIFCCTCWLPSAGSHPPRRKLAFIICMIMKLLKIRVTHFRYILSP